MKTLSLLTFGSYDISMPDTTADPGGLLGLDESPQANAPQTNIMK